ncbi:MAG: group II intron reverse transcriptase/maturase [Pirellulales bacterium]|nr:group II intron reverse transcriptase/maturase [Pirellulales bacterium]
MTAHSKGRTSWLTKLNRIGAISQASASTVFNNIGHIIDEEMLCDAFRRLDGNKAAGIDGKTKASYGKRLHRNVRNLLRRIRRGTYRPKPAKVVHIPKEDGSTRALSLSSLEDKLVQSVVAKILNTIYEPMFLPCSYGGRPNRSAHDALRALSQRAYRIPSGAIVEIDIRKYFDSIPHTGMMACIEEKISDRRFLGLIRILLQSSKLEDGQVIRNEQGCPQGSIASPVLANIYLHHVIDEWFAQISASHLKGEAHMVRYLDDMVFILEREDQAQRLFEVLPKRLARYGLKLHEGKSAVIKAGRVHAARAAARKEKMSTFNFLGFTVYWGKSRSGKMWRMKYRTRRDRFSATLKRLREFLWRYRNTSSMPWLLSRVWAVVRGWVNYHGISDNHQRVKSFILCVKRLLFKWMNRRGGRKRMTWDRYVRGLKRMDFPERYKTVSMISIAPKQT